MVSLPMPWMCSSRGDASANPKVAPKLLENVTCDDLPQVLEGTRPLPFAQVSLIMASWTVFHQSCSPQQRRGRVYGKWIETFNSPDRTARKNKKVGLCSSNETVARNNGAGGYTESGLKLPIYLTEPQGKIKKWI